MPENLPALIEALREELKHYGEMLALLDQQQESAMARATDDLLQAVAAINAQGGVLQTARTHRETCRQAVARQLGLPEETGFTELIPQLPEDYRPLVAALVQENNELLVRVRQRARQNHLLLSRSLELMQRFLSSLFCPGQSATYNGNGVVPAGLPIRSLYEAVV